VEPPVGSRVEPLVRGHGGEAPEAKTLLAFGRSLKGANLPTFKEIRYAKKSDTICVVFSKENDVYKPQYVTDYCTVMKRNRLVHFG